MTSPRLSPALAHALLLLALWLSLAGVGELDRAACRSVWTTGYSRFEFSPFTFDGTSIYTNERIVAASWDIPLGVYVVLEGLGLFRVADRGLLGWDGWIDVAVWHRAEAFTITGRRTACLLAPDELGETAP